MRVTMTQRIPPTLRKIIAEFLVGVASALPVFTTLGSFYFTAQATKVMPPIVLDAFPVWVVMGSVFGIIVQFILMIALVAVFLASPKLSHTRLRLGFVSGLAVGIWLFFFVLN